MRQKRNRLGQFVKTSRRKSTGRARTRSATPKRNRLGQFVKKASSKRRRR